MQVVRGVFPILGPEVLNNFVGGQFGKAVEEIKGLEESLVEVVCGQLHEAAFDNFDEEPQLDVLVFHLLGDDDGLEHELDLLLTELDELGFSDLGGAGFLLHVVAGKQLLLLGLLVGNPDELVEDALLSEAVDDVLPELLLGHDQDVFEVAVDLEVEDVLAVEAEAVHEVDLGGDLLAEGDDVPDPESLGPEAGEVHIAGNLYIENVTLLNI